MAEAFVRQQPRKTDRGPLEYNHAVENSVRSPPLGYVVNSHHFIDNFLAFYRFEKEIKMYDPLIDSLEHAVSKPLFCCGGSLRTDMDKYVLKVKPTSSEADESNWEELTFPSLPLDKLLEYCKPAPFGDIKEMKTVLDPEVRLAYEIEAARFEMRRFLGMSSIEDHIEETLTPGREVELVPYKVNVYGEGGFFKPHVDNPSDHNMIGTLVVCLPSPHKGGELLVNHDGLQHVFDFSKQSGDTSRIQWAAFYSDCIHEVKPVFEGHRVTITYNIVTSERPPSYHDIFNRFKPKDSVSLEEHFEASVESPSLTLNALGNVNKELEKIQSRERSPPSKIGFLLKHKYISKGLQPHLLKGEDKTLFDFLVDKQWTCELISVLSRYQTAEILLEEDLDFEETHEIYKFNVSKSSKPLELFYGAPSRPWIHRGFRQWRVGIPFIEIYRKPTENAKPELVRDRKGCGEWVGNEIKDVGVDKIYLDSAIIVDLCKEL